MKEYKLPEQINIPQTIILADGDFPSSPLAKEWLRECPYVVCCDGAANTYLRFGKMPAAIVGDGDSLLPEIRERYVHLIHRETEQDTNDLSKAFRFCLSQGRRDITIMGLPVSGKIILWETSVCLLIYGAGRSEDVD